MFFGTMSVFPVLSTLILVFGLCEPSNILVISTVSSHSHSIWCNKLAELLVNHGHTVTILDTNPPRKNISNLTHYYLEGAYSWSEELDYVQVSTATTPKHATDEIFSWSLPACKNMMFSANFKKFLDDCSLKSQPFDLIIHDITNCENFLGLVHFLGYPKLMFVTAFGENTNVLYVMNNHQNFIHSPLHMSPYIHPMSSWDKLENFAYSVYHHYQYSNYVGELDSYSKKVFGNSTPDVFDIGRTSAVALINTHPILDGAKYLSPGIVHIGGFHIDLPKKLDKDIQAFIDGAKEGVIYFSLGSNVQSSLMSKDRIDMFLNVFRKLKQRVLWKFEDSSITNIPENVMISKWFSQNDILAHPNVKVFISHSGLLGTQEAIHHGVPMVVMPFFIDQHFTASKLVLKGVAVLLVYSNLSEHKIEETINQILTNDNYRKEMKRWSRIFRSTPVPPKQLALHWIDFVLAHDNLEFLQPAQAYASSKELFFFDVRMIAGIIIGYLLFVLYNRYPSKPRRRRRN